MRLFLSFLLILGLILASCSEKREQVRPTVGPITESVYASGALKAQEQYEVYSQVNGLLVFAYVTEGDLVQAGDPLFLIDDRASSLSTRNSELNVALLEKNVSGNSPVLAQLRAKRTAAEENLQIAEEAYLDGQRLAEQELLSENELEQRRLAFVTAETGLEAAIEAYEETRARLNTELEVARNELAISLAAKEDRTVRSLVDGMVYDVMLEKGELATTQSPLAVLGSADNFYIELQVDEYDIGKIEADQRVLITMDSYPGRLMEARITKVDPLMDERSRTFTVKAMFTNPPKRLYPHLTVEANIVIRTNQNALTIPSDFLLDDTHVLIGQEERSEIEIGLRDLQRIEVLSGLDSTSTVYKP